MFNERLSTFVHVINPYHKDLVLPVASHIKNRLWKMHHSFVLQENTPPPPSIPQRDYQTQVFAFTKEFLSLVRPLHGLVMIELGSSLARSWAMGELVWSACAVCDISTDELLLLGRRLPMLTVLPLPCCWGVYVFKVAQVRQKSCSVIISVIELK